jgi:hypothetical protein
MIIIRSSSATIGPWSLVTDRPRCPRLFRSLINAVRERSILNYRSLSTFTSRSQVLGSTSFFTFGGRMSAFLGYQEPINWKSIGCLNSQWWSVRYSIAGNPNKIPPCRFDAGRTISQVVFQSTGRSDYRPFDNTASRSVTKTY